MFDFYKVAAAVPDLKVADVNYNLDKMLEMIDDAASNSASIIVFPELGLTGYTCGDLFFQSSLIEETRIAINRLVSYSSDKQLFIIFGAPINIDGQLYNAAFSVYKGKLLGINIKTFLPNYNEFYEKRWFSSAADLKRKQLPSDDILDGQKETYMIPVGNDFIINVKGQFTFGVEICEDLWAPVTPSCYMTLSGAELMVNLSASNETIGKRSYRQELIRSKSASLMCDYLYVSAGSGESTTDLVFSGHTMLYENGRKL
ncbi:MAG: nitrilase-related carbon-nitrogen hydrolase, partial [Wujia sp.]